MQEWLQSLPEWTRYTLIKTENSSITVASIFLFVFLIILLFVLTKLFQKFIENRILTRTKADLGARRAISSIIYYIILFVGIIVIVQNTAIDLSGFSMLAGAIGIGVGFGLQNIVSNFIAGIIILFERPIKIGDRIEVNKIEGDVTHIGARSTHVLSNNNITIIVPNSKFITESVVNWTAQNRLVRFCIPVTVANGADARLVEQLLIDVAKENSDVVKNPEPGVRLMRFSDHGLDFELRAWSTTLVHRKSRLFSALNFGIYDKFNKHGIEFPNSQHDIYIKTPKNLSELTAMLSLKENEGEGGS